MHKVRKYYPGGGFLLSLTSSPASLLGFTPEKLPNYNVSTLIGQAFTLYAINNLPSAGQSNKTNNTDLNTNLNTIQNISATSISSMLLPEQFTLPDNIEQRMSKTAQDAINSTSSSSVTPTFNKKFQDSTFGKNYGSWSAGLEMGNSLVTAIGGTKEEYDGEAGAVAQGVDSAYDAVQGAVSSIPGWGQAASLIMGANKLVGGIANRLGGGTSGMTTTDAILGSSFFLLTPFGLINGFGGKKSNTITKNNEAFAQVGSSYGGSSSTVDDALTKSGKKYGLFSSRARNKANAEIAEAKRQLSIVENISGEATDRSNIALSMSAINLNRYLLALQGGYLLANTRVGKKGMSLELILKSKLITKAQKGLKLDPIQYSVQRFPILKNVHVVLQYDPQFLPEGFGNIEYIQAIHDNLPYYIVDGLPYLKKEKGKSVIVYNDKANEEDVALDMLSHGLREQDKHWRTNIIPQLENEEAFRNAIEEELFWEYGISPKEWHRLSEKEKDEIGSKIWEQLNADLRFGRRQIDEDYNLKYNNILDGLVRALLVKDEYRKSRGYDYPQEFLDSLRNTNTWKKAYDYIMEINTPSMKNGGTISSTIELINPNDIEEFKEGGQLCSSTTIELINPNDIEEFKEGGSINIIPEGALHARKHHMDMDGITKKGIPVVDNKGEQQAEIERSEIILRLEVTKKIEELEREYYKEDTSLKKKDELALEAGKLLVDELLFNTIDNTKELI